MIIKYNKENRIIQYIIFYEVYYYKLKILRNPNSKESDDQRVIYPLYRD
jgi:hypothetical protein